MKKMITWFAKNPVAANMLMALIVFMGIMTAGTIKLETFPEINLDMVSIQVVYLGAAPEEVEEGVCVRVEEAIQGLEGIKKITSVASENVGSISVELELDADAAKVLDEIKSRVDAIDTFPEETEEPVVSEVTSVRSVISVAVYGNTDEAGVKHVAERVRDDLTAIEGISVVQLAAARPYEVSVEVSREALRAHGLTFTAVANAVRSSSLDLPGGSVKTAGGEILLRAKGQAYRGEQFENLVVLTRPDGSRVTLGEVATIVDGFEDTDQASTFDGKPAVIVKVFRVGDQDALDVASKVKAYIEDTESLLPEGMQLAIWQDMSKVLQDRLSLLTRNGIAGFLLVILVLTLFLRTSLAFWVSLGIPISFLGGLWMMPHLDVSINLISLFAFIVVLGIVVDDAIVVGENIHSYQERGGDPLQAAINGASEVAVPVIFAVLTTVAAFSPMLSVEGRTGKIMVVIPLVVIPTLLFSLVESLLILPAHVRHLKQSDPNKGVLFVRIWRKIQKRFADGLQWFIEHAYKPSLEFALHWRYLTASVGIATLALTVGILGGGFIKFTFFPDVEADFVTAAVTMPQGTPVEVTARAVAQIEKAAFDTRDEYDEQGAAGDESVFRHLVASVGGRPVSDVRDSNGGGQAGNSNGSHLGEVAIELAFAENRTVSSTDIVARWRELTGTVPDAIEVSYTSSLFSPGEAINIQLAGPDHEALRRAAQQVKAAVAEYPGAYDVADSHRPGKQEIKLATSPRRPRPSA